MTALPDRIRSLRECADRLRTHASTLQREVANKHKHMRAYLATAEGLERTARRYETALETQREAAE